MQEIPVGTIVYKKVRLGKLVTGYKCSCNCGIVFEKVAKTANEPKEYGTALFGSEHVTYSKPVGVTVLKMEVTGAGFIADFDDTEMGLRNRQNKGRVASARVLEDVNHNEGYTYISSYDNTFEYKIGATVSSKLSDKNVACDSGIHCFLTENEARAYSL